jgi:transposase
MSLESDIEIREKHLKHIAEITKDMKHSTSPIKAESRSDMVYRKDRLRQNYDIRNMKPENLTTYQNVQLKEVKKQLYDFEMRDLRKAIFRTFEGPEEKVEFLFNSPSEKEIVELEVII